MASPTATTDGDEQREKKLEIRGDGKHASPPTWCKHCHLQLHEHDRVRVTPDDGPPGVYHYEYRCPDDGGDGS